MGKKAMKEGHEEISAEDMAEVLNGLHEAGKTASEAIFILVTATAHILDHEGLQSGTFIVNGYNIKYEAETETTKQKLNS
jgi:hypothetical protein